ncbi:hypothetical protein EST38_g9872, partial [Candolleomyces aberdarensis]
MVEKNLDGPSPRALCTERRCARVVIPQFDTPSPALLQPRQPLYCSNQPSQPLLPILTQPNFGAPPPTPAPPPASQHTQPDNDNFFSSPDRASNHEVQNPDTSEDYFVDDSLSEIDELDEYDQINENSKLDFDFSSMEWSNGTFGPGNFGAGAVPAHSSVSTSTTGTTTATALPIFANAPAPKATAPIPAFARTSASAVPVRAPIPP